MKRLTNFLWLAAGMVIGCLGLIIGLITARWDRTRASGWYAETEHPLYHGR